MTKRRYCWVELSGLTTEGIEYEADPKHRQMILEYFGFEEGSKGLAVNGDKEDKVEAWDDELLERAEAKEFRGLAARLNFLSLEVRLYILLSFYFSKT